MLKMIWEIAEKGLDHYKIEKKGTKLRDKRAMSVSDDKYWVILGCTASNEWRIVILKYNDSDTIYLPRHFSREQLTTMRASLFNTKRNKLLISILCLLFMPPHYHRSFNNDQEEVSMNCIYAFSSTIRISNLGLLLFITTFAWQCELRVSNTNESFTRRFIAISAVICCIN